MAPGIIEAKTPARRRLRLTPDWPWYAAFLIPAIILVVVVSLLDVGSAYVRKRFI